jgi:hypothetical protein
MRCLIAAFDQAHLCSDRTYWTWRHPDLQASILDDFYYEHAAKHLPGGTATIAADSIVGGCASVGNEWLCWYRFVDGGRDKHGRPGRYVLLAAFVRRYDHSGYDWSGILESSLFLEIAKNAPVTCPIPEPGDLELDWTPSPVIVDTSDLDSQLLADGKVDFEKAGDLQCISAVCQRIPSDRSFDCFFTCENGIAHGAISLSENKQVWTANVVTEHSDVSIPRVPTEQSEHTVAMAPRTWPVTMYSAINGARQRINQQRTGLIAGMLLGIAGTLAVLHLQDFFGHSRRDHSVNVSKLAQPIDSHNPRDSAVENIK